MMSLSALSMLSVASIRAGWSANLFHRGVAALRRNVELLDLPSEPSEGVAQEVGGVIAGHIEFIRVTVRRPGIERPVVRDVSLSASPGQSLAIIGGVGAGKSSLLELLPRLVVATEGCVRIDGRDIRTVPLATVRTAVGYVSQFPMLINGTIRDNMRVGRRSATDSAIREVLTITELIDDIRTFPNGLETFVGERGVKLSGGQRQRLCLARVLLRDPQILVLDDPLSAVDTPTKTAIFENLRLRFRDRTVIIACQSLCSISWVGHVVFMDAGEIATRSCNE
jgi:ATP-binding cassette subfamily B protein